MSENSREPIGCPPRSDSGAALAAVCGAVATIAGALILTGWLARFPPLVHLLPGAIAVKLNTAVEFIVLGVALVIAARCSHSPRPRFLRAVSASLGITASLLASLQLFQEISGISLGIDEAVVRDFTAASSSVPPGRMSVITASNFLLLGLSLAFSQFPRRHHSGSQLSVFFSLSLTVTALAAYLYGAESFSRIYPYTTMSVTTGILFLVLILGILAQHPRRGFLAMLTSRSPGGIILRRLAPAAILALLLLGFLARRETHEVFEDASFSALFVAVGGAILFTIGVWLTARRLNAAYARTEEQAIALEDEQSRARSLSGQLELLLSHSPVAAALFDCGMRYMWASKRWIDDFKLDPDRLIGLSHYELLPDLPEGWKGIHRRCLDGTSARADEELLVHADGTRRWLRWEACPWRSETGEIGGLMMFSEDISPRKIAEESLRESNLTLERRVEERTQESRLQATILENMAEGVCMVNPKDGSILYANPKFSSMFGYESGELAGKPVAILNHEPTTARAQAKAEEIMSRIMRDGAYRYEIQNARKDGSPFWCRATTSRFEHSEYGTVLVAVHEDITEQKRIADQLSRAQAVERRIRAQLDGVSQAGSVISESATHVRETGLEKVLHTVAVQAQTITGADFVALGIGDDPSKPFDPWVVAGLSPDLAEVLGRIPRPQGVLGAVSHGGHSIRLDDLKAHPSFRGLPEGHPDIGSFLGTPIRFSGKVIGNLYMGNSPGRPAFTVDDQRAIEILSERAGSVIETARLYESEADQRRWLDAIINQMPESVLVLDRSGKLLNINRAAQAFVTRESAEPGSSAFQIFDSQGEPVPVSERPLMQVLSGRKSIDSREMLALHRDGRRVPILATAAQIKSAQGELIGAVLVAQDISIIKELERQREEWTSLIAHDLRQPVSVVSLNAQLLQRMIGATAGKETSLIGHILSASYNLQRLISDLLDVSRIEAKRLNLELKTTDVAALVRQVIERLSPTIEGHAIRERIDGNLPPLRLDATRIEQVLGNLLSNAAKYGSPGSPIRLAVRALDGTTVEISVTNAGPGISSDDLPLLFSRFNRSRSARNGNAPGIGLGLYICRGIVEAHGGRIWAKSTPGDETTFSFTLPGKAESANPFGLTRASTAEERTGESENRKYGR